MPLAEECAGPVPISGGSEVSNDRERLKSETTPPMKGQATSGMNLSDDDLVPEELGLSPAWRQELLRRIRAYHENPGSAIPWDDVVRMIEQELRRVR